MAGLSVADIAALLSSFFAAVAAIASFLAIVETRKKAREQQAMEMVRSYLQIAIEHPDLSTEGGKKKRQQQYEWFVSFVLVMSQSVLRAFPGNVSWKALMKNQLQFNSEELRQWKRDNVDDLKLYGSEVQELVDQVLAQGKP
jgi:hypothetical protein